MEPSGKIMLITPDQIQNLIVQEVATIKGVHQFVINPEEIFILNKATRVGSISTSNQILSDGSLYFLHPYDPVFLLIPILRKQENRARPVSDLLIESNCSALESYLKLEEKLSEICSVVTHSQTMYFKLDDAKLAAWIEKKLQSLIFNIRASYKIAADGSNAEKIAIGILSEYLEDDLILSLLARFSIQPSELSEKLINSDLNPHKRLHEETKFQSNKKPKPAASTRQVKQDRNQKSMFDFFRKT